MITRQACFAIIVAWLTLSFWVNTPVRAELVAHYTFDEDASDETGRHDGELVGDAFAGVLNTGRPTGVLELDGVTGYVAVADADQLDLTVARARLGTPNCRKRTRVGPTA